MTTMTMPTITGGNKLLVNIAVINVGTAAKKNKFSDPIETFPSTSIMVGNSIAESTAAGT